MDIIVKNGENGNTIEVSKDIFDDLDSLESAVESDLQDAMEIPKGADPSFAPEWDEWDRTEIARHIIGNAEVCKFAHEQGVKATWLKDLVPMYLCDFALNWYKKNKELPSPRLLYHVVCNHIDQKHSKEPAEKRNELKQRIFDFLKIVSEQPPVDVNHTKGIIEKFTKESAITDLFRKYKEKEITFEQYDAEFQKVKSKFEEKSKSEDYELCTLTELMNADGFTYLIDRHIPAGSLVTVFGASGGGKSFYCLDMALSLKNGVPFLDNHETKQSRVLYLYSEGQQGFKFRVLAWHLAKGIALTDENFVYSKVSHNLSDLDECKKLIDKATAKMGGVDVIFVDTLSRNFGGADTDNNKDMQVYLRGVDWIRENTTGTVVNVHHTGHADPERERGAKSLRDYVDVSICIVGKEESIEVSCKKMKDDEPFKPYVLQKTPIQCNCTVKGETRTSLYLTLRGEKAEIKKAEKRSEEEIIKDKLLELIPIIAFDAEPSPDSSITAKLLMHHTGLKQQRLSELLTELSSNNAVFCFKESNSASKPWLYYRKEGLEP